MKLYRRSIPLFYSLFFITLGGTLIPYPGIQNDEALFGNALYTAGGLAFTVSLFKQQVPLMLMSYLGALKSWLYAPLFQLVTPTAVSVRMPMLLAGAATVWLFHDLLNRVAGRRAAAIGGLLLATDTMFLLTTCFDWGPVALQHLLLVAGMLAVQAVYHTGQRNALALGFFFFGLALWDKALALWILSGIGVAALLVFPREIRKLATPGNTAVAAGAFLAGALPFVFYNIRYPLATFRENSSFAFDDVRGKSLLMLSTLDGSALFDYVARDDPDGHVRKPDTAVERGSVHLSGMTGERRRSLLPWTLTLSALFLPEFLWFSRNRRLILFALVAGAIAWIQMLGTRGAGGSAHHAVLLWPLPHFVIAVILAAAWDIRHSILRKLAVVAAAGIAAITAGSSLLVSNQYLAQLITNGPGKAWTDALGPLSDRLRQIPAKQIYINDWGMFDTLQVLNRGRLPLRVGSDPLSKPRLDENDVRVVRERLALAGSIFVSHTDGNEEFPGVNFHMREIAEKSGFRREMLAVIPDRNGREMFVIDRFVR